MDRYNLFVSLDHDALTQPGRFELDPDRAFRSILRAPPHRRLCLSPAPHRAVYSASTARRRIHHRIVTEWPRAQGQRWARTAVLPDCGRGDDTTLRCSTRPFHSRTIF